MRILAKEQQEVFIPKFLVNGEELPTLYVPPIGIKRGIKNRFVVFVSGSSKKGSPFQFMEPFMKVFAVAGFHTLYFDFRGVFPKSKIRFEESGFHTRIEDLSTVLDGLMANFDIDQLVVYAWSMGTYVASHMICRGYPISDLILVEPSAYDKQIIKNNIPFGDNSKDALNPFTKILRTVHSWCQSDAFRNIGDFLGRLLVIQFLRDSQIPHDIPWFYCRAPKKPQDRRLVGLDYDHGVSFGEGSGSNASRRRTDILIEVIPWLTTKRIL